MNNSAKLIDALTEVNIDTKSQNGQGSSQGSRASLGYNNDTTDNDRLWQTLNAIIYQRNFLYSMFEAKKVGERKGRVGETLSCNNELAYEALANLDVMKN